MRGYGKLFETETKNGLKWLEEQKLLTFGKNEALGGRFHRLPQLHPDFYVFTSLGQFFYLECKSTQAKKSFAFKNIKSHQIRELRRVSKWPNGRGYFLINFRSKWDVAKEDSWNETYIVTIKQFLKYREVTGRESFEKQWIVDNCLKLKRVKYDGITKNGKPKLITAWDMNFLVRP